MFICMSGVFGTFAFVANLCDLMSRNVSKVTLMFVYVPVLEILKRSLALQLYGTTYSLSHKVGIIEQSKNDKNIN